MPRNSSTPKLLAAAAAVAGSFASHNACAADWLLHSAAVADNEAGRTSGAPTHESITTQAAELDAWTGLLREPRGGDDNMPAIASAYVIEGSPETTLTLTGEAEIRRAGTVVKGDQIIYTQATGEVQTVGSAQVSRQGAQFDSPEFTYNLDDETGGADNVDYEYKPRGLRGSAACLRFRSADVTDLENVTVTSCDRDNPAWWVEMNTLTLDEYEQAGTGTGAVLKIAGIPVLGSPWFTFPLSSERQSGFLAPTMGFSSSKGFDLSVPYYFNIAPNYDYTFTPRYVSKRGLLLGNEVRYLGESIEGEVLANYMPNDRQTGTDRYSIQANIKGRWNGFSYGINYNRVSDDDFNDDFSSSLRDNDYDNILPQNYWVTYGSTYWNAAVRILKNQAIEGQSKPYEKEPQFTWTSYIADLGGFEITTKLDATRFVHPTRLEGDRFVYHQEIAYPVMSAGWFITPKAQFIGRSYNLDRARYTGGDKNPSVGVPILSLDSGLIFERDLDVANRSILQTLEPRLFYSYTPYRDQSDIPLFDSSLADVNFAQLWSENAWSGYDRIAETNQITASVTTRFIDAESGLEWVRASIGQRFYFNDWTLSASGNRISMEEQKSDLLASIGAHLTRSISAQFYSQWSWERSSFQKLTAGVRWQPKPMSVIGLYYRYDWADDANSDDYIDQIDLSLQWPLTDKLYALARQNYSLYDHKFIESLVGVEYHAGCWTLRAVAQRYTRNDDRDETSFFLQLELNGLGSIGSSPLTELQRSIRGYQVNSPVPTAIGTYDYY